MMYDNIKSRFKSPESYQRWLDGKKKGGSSPKHISPESREKLRQGGILGNKIRWHPETL